MKNIKNLIHFEMTKQDIIKLKGSAMILYSTAL